MMIRQVVYPFDNCIAKYVRKPINEKLASKNKCRLYSIEYLDSQIYYEAFVQIVAENKGRFIPDISDIKLYIKELSDDGRLKFKMYNDNYYYQEKVVLQELRQISMSGNQIQPLLEDGLERHNDAPEEIGSIKLIQRVRFSGLCVYFLCLNGKIVYVGQTDNVHSRVTGHLDKEFDDVYYFPVDIRLVLIVEQSFIAYFRPKYNKENIKLTECLKSIAEGVLMERFAYINETTHESHTKNIRQILGSLRRHKNGIIRKAKADIQKLSNDSPIAPFVDIDRNELG